MLGLTANIAFLFPDRTFLDRIDAAKSAGFDNVECHFPYDLPIPVIKERLDAVGVRLTGLNTQPGDREKGEWGFAGVPGREEQFRRDFAQAVDYASRLGASCIHVMAGTVSPDQHATARKTYISNLRTAAREIEGSGLILLLEPLNSRDAPNYLVSRSDEISEIIREIDHPSVRLLFDVYHVQIMEGDLIRRLEKHRSIIGHVQVAGVPDRAEPDQRNEINYRAIFDALVAIGYDGLVGLEYRPRGSTEMGLHWLREFNLIGPSEGTGAGRRGPQQG
jgi:hydroxypyruvate isomerase